MTGAFDDAMTEEEKQLFLSDLRAVCGEYFEDGGSYSVDMTDSGGGLSVCIIFNAARVKKFKKPR